MLRIILLILLLPELISAQSAVSHSLETISFAERNSARASFTEASADKSYFDVHYYRCEWAIDPEVRYITGKVTAVFSIVKPIDTLQFDLTNALEVDSVYYHGTTRSFRRTNTDLLSISYSASLQSGLTDSVTIFYHGVPATSSAFVTRLQDGAPVMWTLSEPYGAKDWWPCKNNQSDKADSIDIFLTYPAKYKSSSNGLLLTELTTAGKTTAHWKHRYPISSYLVAIAIADYVVSVDTARVSNRIFPIKTYAYPAFVDYFRTNASFVPDFFEKFSSLFGLYPFEKEGYSQTQFLAGGGMEHQTNSFLTNNDPGTAIHELGHQWFGNKVTCASWRDIWLNEGFASYLQFLLYDLSLVDYRSTYLNNTRLLVTAQADGSLRVNDTTNVNRIFNFRLSYAKGMYVVHMIRWKLGDSLFYSALRRFLNDPRLAYGVATTADLQRNLQEASGQDFSEFFRDWYEGQGHPTYQLRWSLNKNNWMKMKLSQTSSHPSVSFFEMPVPVLVRGAGRDSLIILNHKTNGEEFWINTGFVPDTLIIDPDLWLLSANNSVAREAIQPSASNEVRVFPNPSPQTLTVSLRNPSGKRLSLNLVNAAGQKIYAVVADLSGRDELYRINMNQFPSGVYWIQIVSDDFSMVKKVVRL